jgi:hypothetical protein
MFIAFLHVFLLCREHDPCSLYLGAMITGMGIFIECRYGSNTGIAAATFFFFFLKQAKGTFTAREQKKYKASQAQPA